MDGLQPVRYYEFNSFRLDTFNRCLLRGGQTISLQQRHYDILLLLVRNRGRTVTKEEFHSQVWKDVYVEKEALRWHIKQLRAVLGDDFNHPQFIKTIPKKGYCFIAEVTELPDDASPPPEIASGPLPLPEQENVEPRPRPQPVTAQTPPKFPLWPALAGCALYAGLYAVALLVEIAYEFDRYGRTGLWVAAAVFLWVWTTASLALRVGWEGARRGQKMSLYFCLLALLLSAALTVGGAALFLPATPVTQARFQTQTAQTAYLKVSLYFLFLAIFYLAIPFHFIAAMRRELQEGEYRSTLELLTGSSFSLSPGGAIYIGVRWLGVVLVFTMALSLVGTSRLLENLLPGAYMNLFTQLYYLRNGLYFIVGLVCLAWYYHALNELKRECLAAVNANRDGQDK